MTFEIRTAFYNLNSTQTASGIKLLDTLAKVWNFLTSKSKKNVVIAMCFERNYVAGALQTKSQMSGKYRWVSARKT